LLTTVLRTANRQENTHRSPFAGFRFDLELSLIILTSRIAGKLMLKKAIT
jgi:hypothetical protein